MKKLLLFCGIIVLAQCSCNTPSIQEVAKGESKDRLHTFINEIWGDELLKKEGEQYLLNTEADNLFDNTEIVKNSKTVLEFWTHWSGTSGSEHKSFIYFLLEGAAYPTVLQFVKQNEDLRSSSVLKEAKKENAWLTLEGHSEEEVYRFVEAIAMRDFGIDDSREAFEIYVWQKKGTTWEKVNELFPEGLKQMISDYVPVYEGSKENKGLFFDRIYLDYLESKSAEILLKELYPEEQDDSYVLNYENNILTIGASESHSFKLKWEDGKFSLIGKPSKKPSIQQMYTESCSETRFVSGQSYRFKGTVGTSEIEMELLANKEGDVDYLTAQGTYNYKSTKSKMQLQTYCLNQPFLNKNIVIIREKEGNIREKFYGKWTSDCRIEGTWAHWGSLKIEDFYLELVH